MRKLSFLILACLGGCIVENSVDFSRCYENAPAFLECTTQYRNTPYFDDLIDGSGALFNGRDFGYK